MARIISQRQVLQGKRPIGFAMSMSWFAPWCDLNTPVCNRNPIKSTDCNLRPHMGALLLPGGEPSSIDVMWSTPVKSSGHKSEM